MVVAVVCVLFGSGTEHLSVYDSSVVFICPPNPKVDLYLANTIGLFFPILHTV